MSVINTIHADTQGQSAAIFGLAHLLGIQLQPRIRNWKGLHFFRSNPGVRYEHIDHLFTKRVAFREPGYVARTIFLLDCLSDVELRRLIQAATNKSEWARTNLAQELSLPDV